jgi:hypothetical protein
MRVSSAFIVICAVIKVLKCTTDFGQLVVVFEKQRIGIKSRTKLVRHV